MKKDQFYQFTQSVSHLPERVTVGFSGGADSTALMCLLLARRREDGIFLTAAHVNHGMRGDSSDGDEDFVRDFCLKNNVPCIFSHLSLEPHSSEESARKARYGCFADAVHEFRTDCIVLAHHLDDQTETLLMRLMRGSGLTGLAGIAPDSVENGIRICRPLLNVSRSQLRQYLTSIGQPWREDESNQDNSYLRNSVRNILLPMMEEISPGCSQRIGRCSDTLRIDNNALSLEAEKAYGRCVELNAVSVSRIQKESESVRRRVLRTWFNKNLGCNMDERNLSAEKTEELAGISFMRAGSKCNIPGGGWCMRGWTHIHIVCGNRCMTEDAKTDITYEVVSSLANISSLGDGITCQLLPCEFAASLTLRNIRKGDFIKPFGSDFTKSIDDYLTDRHVDYPFRKSIKVLAWENEIMLVPGVGCGNIPKCDTFRSNSRQYVMIKWNGDIPWKKEKNTK